MDTTLPDPISEVFEVAAALRFIHWTLDAIPPDLASRELQGSAYLALVLSERLSLIGATLWDRGFQPQT